MELINILIVSILIINILAIDIVLLVLSIKYRERIISVFSRYRNKKRIFKNRVELKICNDQLPGEKKEHLEAFAVIFSRGLKENSIIDETNIAYYSDLLGIKLSINNNISRRRISEAVNYTEIKKNIFEKLCKEFDDYDLLACLEYFNSSRHDGRSDIIENGNYNILPWFSFMECTAPRIYTYGQGGCAVAVVQINNIKYFMTHHPTGEDKTQTGYIEKMRDRIKLCNPESIKIYIVSQYPPYITGSRMNKILDPICDNISFWGYIKPYEDIYSVKLSIQDNGFRLYYQSNKRRFWERTKSNAAMIPYSEFIEFSDSDWFPITFD